MYCQSCGKERRPNSNICQHCGMKQKQKLSPFTILLLSLLLIGTIAGSVWIVTTFYSKLPAFMASDAVNQIDGTSIEPETPEDLGETVVPATEKRELQDKQKHELTEIIAASQDTVYTVYTDYSQGSGFLYNHNGAVVTNSHVVEGATEVYVKAIDGSEHLGKVIGYSNETDVAVIQVPDLVGTEPFPLELTDSSKIGEEIIALGSPLGLENTATMGYITGKNRSFVIDPYVYENLYQISAPISPGSSGGPLISKETEKIIAINSAESIEEASIGFSIPLFTVHGLIDSWIEQPMKEEDILAQFNDSNGAWGEGYFDGGDYAEDEDYYNYWEYDYDDFWDEFGNALWGYLEGEDSYNDEWHQDLEDPYYNPETDENMYYDEETGQWSYYDEIEDLWYYYDEYEETWYYYDELDGLWYYYDESIGDYVPY
jgi:serine protease Do